MKAATKARWAARAAVAAEGPLIPGRDWRLTQQGREVVMELALDEVWLTGVPGGGRLEKVPAQPDLDMLLAQAAALERSTGGKVRLVMYPRGDTKRSVLTRRVLSDSVVLEWDESVATRRQLEAAGVREMRQPDYAPELWVARVEGDAAAALRLVEAVRGMPGVRQFEPQLARQQQKKAVPNDPLFSSQWHLRNTGQGGGRAGTDAKVVGVWDVYQGAGIRIGVIDDGVQLDHPDLVANRAPSGHFDWNGRDSNPAPDLDIDDHGTAVAGVVAGRGNNGLGVSGAAPQAQIVGMRLISEPATDDMEADAISHLNGTIQIKNNSWGPPDDAAVLGELGPLTRAAMQNAAENGRGGRGVILTWAGGNGREGLDHSNKDGYANNRHVLAVGAVTNSGAQSSYSESGANLVVSAPSDGGSRGIVTTDLTGNNGYNRSGSVGEPSDRNYTNSFGGTSSATPLVSGVVALMLEANPDLNYRDVKEILMRSSTRLSPTSTSWVSRSGGRPHLPPIKHHPSFGGGMVNAEAAVAMAEDWDSLPPLASTLSASWSARSIIPDGVGEVSQNFTFTSGSPRRVETVEVTVDIDHEFRGDLEIELVSPGGTRSFLVTANGFDYGLNPNNDRPGMGFKPWTFSSVRHWGESAVGTWRVVVRDKARLDTGRWNSATVRIYGTSETRPTLTSFGSAQMLAEGATAAFSATGTGSPLAFELRLNGVVVAGSSSGGFSIPDITTAQAGSYTVAAVNSVGEDVSGSIPVTVVRVETAPVSVMEGRAVSLTATAAGPLPLSYQWTRDGNPLQEGVDGVGTQSRTLTLAAAEAADEGDYECTVSDGVRTLSAGVRPLTVVLRPVLNAQTLSNTVVSGAPLYTITAQNAPTRFTATGLPAGMRLDPVTGVLSGRPTVPGVYSVRVTASNGAGSSQAVTFSLEVESLPPGALNTFRGVVEAQAAINQDLGGSISLTVSRTGSYTGTLVLGGRTHPFSGQLSAQPGGVNPVGTATIRRTGLPTLSVPFEINVATAEASGRVVDGLGAEAPWEAQSSQWHARNNPATTRAGYYTVLLGNGGAMPGEGFCTATVTTAGAVRITGRTGEARPFTLSTTLSRTGEAGVFVRTDSTRSSLHGWLEFDAGVTAPLYPEARIGGSLNWRRLPQSPTTRLYAGGFAVGLSPDGRKHFRPVSGSLLLQLTPPLLPGALNGEVIFSGPVINAAALASELGGTSFSLSLAHKAQFAAARSVDNRASVKLAVNPSTGLLSGSLTLVDPHPLGGRDVLRPVVFYAIAGETEARGCVVIPELPNPVAVPPTTLTTSPLLSAGVLIRAP